MKKILIIEDDRKIAELERDYLEINDFQVALAADGDTGLLFAVRDDFDLIVLDLMLPGVDGFTICRRIREKKETPIIMVSAKRDDVDKIRGLGLGADDYMVKPCLLYTSRCVLEKGCVVETALKSLRLSCGSERT